MKRDTLRSLPAPVVSGLLDYFAGQALPTVISETLRANSRRHLHDSETQDLIARRAYDMAHAMVREREARAAELASLKRPGAI